MSRIGKLPVPVPDNVTVTPQDGVVTVKGPKGEISLKVKPSISVAVEDDKEVVVTRKRETKVVKSMHGTVRNLINNAIKGVTEGYSKTLELVGTGYRVRMDGRNLNISIGFSHPVIVEPVEGVTFQVDGQNKIIVSGVNKETVGQVAANIRAIRPPEPYKGKGIKYENEVIIKKAGKTSKGE